MFDAMNRSATISSCKNHLLSNTARQLDYFCHFSGVFKRSITFPVAFEILIWILYVCFYKYSFHLEKANLPHIPDANFPYLVLCLYSICSTIYIIPYYRWIAPKLLDRQRYFWLFLITAGYFLFVSLLNDYIVSGLFMVSTVGTAAHAYFQSINLHHFLELDLIMTDLIAFLCIALSRFSFKSEQRRHEIETDHLQLQLSMLKNQLQPHFLFNTLNGLYALSLSNSKDTPRFILLLSQMMQYILYDCEQETVLLKDEVVFLEGYFELEQRKFPEAQISFRTTGLPTDLTIPPLLFLPLVENSFKHGRHKLENEAIVDATLEVTTKHIVFTISNDMLPASMPGTQVKRGGIGLKNISQRLALYYPGKHRLNISELNNQYIAELKLSL
jgi:sensor histidine kinase YesM